MGFLDMFIPASAGFTPDQRSAAGNRGLLNASLNLINASSDHAGDRPSMLQIMGQGVQGYGQGVDQYTAAMMANAQAQKLQLENQTGQNKQSAIQSALAKMYGNQAPASPAQPQGLSSFYSPVASGTPTAGGGPMAGGAAPMAGGTPPMAGGPAPMIDPRDAAALSMMDVKLPEGLMPKVSAGWFVGQDGQQHYSPGGEADPRYMADVTRQKAEAGKQVDLSYDPRIASATAGAKKQADLTYDPKIAAATETAKNAPLVDRARQEGAISLGNSVELAKQNNQLQLNSPQNVFNRENTLRDEFNKLTGDFRTVQDAYNKIKSASPSGTGDMSLLYSYVKLLDPNSVVRESEFATAAKAGSYGQEIQGYVSRIINGEKLPDDLRTKFRTEAKNIYDAQKRGYDQQKTNYTGLADRSGVPAENVIPDYSKANSPEMPLGAKQASDGNYYMPDPQRPGKYLKVVP